MTSEDLANSHFNHIFHLPSSLITPALHVSKYAGHFVAEEQNSISWTDFLNNIRHVPGINLGMLGFHSDAINQHTTTLKGTIDNIVQLLVPPGQDRGEQLKAALEVIFTNRNSIQSSGSGWQCQVHFAYVDEGGTEAPKIFHSLVATIKLEVEGGEEPSWWKPQGEVLRSLSVVIDVVELAVREGFRDPIEVPSQ
ncbi:hypothetical protein V5O48_002187 [Marasmius crinis-equi]|uniref:Uncharacterized protein n=1 Tax=Marasmius crinis-equi TaxID=585013 RepID=A0ABR3FWF2_9AGAR